MSTDNAAVGDDVAQETDHLANAEEHIEAGNLEAAVSDLIQGVQDAREEAEEARKEAEFATRTAFDLEEILLGEYDTAGADTVVDEHGSVFGQLNALRQRNAATQNDQNDQIRDGILEAHRWMLDLDVNDCADRSDTQERVARLFRRFIRKAAGESDQGVDASGQTYSVTTGAATDILVAEDALSGVKKRSRSTVVARVMRETQDATLDVACQCEDVDECAHALLTFQPGKPHTLAVQKQDLEEYMREYTSRLAQDTDDGVEASEAPADDETTETASGDDLAEETERVFSAEAVQDD